jgi:hypothetical protein
MISDQIGTGNGRLACAEHQREFWTHKAYLEGHTDATGCNALRDYYIIGLLKVAFCLQSASSTAQSCHRSPSAACHPYSLFGACLAWHDGSQRDCQALSNSSARNNLGLLESFHAQRQVNEEAEEIHDDWIGPFSITADVVSPQSVRISC